MMRVKARVRFAFYLGGPKSEPSYFVYASDRPDILPVHGNVGMEELHKAGVPVPLTPTFATWDLMGRPKCAGLEAAV